MKNQWLLNNKDEPEIRRLRRKLSPDLVEVLHMLDAFENRFTADAHLQIEPSVAAR
jgi:hypothetical protein